LQRARTTKGIDLRVEGSPSDILAKLRAAARRDLGDFMVFEVNPDDRHSAIQNDGMQYEGLRFRAECSLGGKIYGRPFGIDVAFGDPILGEPQTMIADDLLAFVGVAPPTLLVYPVETHTAEKLHAYTMPRARPNSRVKDLPDLALIATAGPIDAKRLREAMEQTFSFRDTHEVPSQLPDPPIIWAKPYESMAREDQLRWSTLDEVAQAVRTFLNPVFVGGLGASWVPEEWRWVE
jgi:Nucleotidyl transferase AbiEii toxin, Type IV TA system